MLESVGDGFNSLDLGLGQNRERFQSIQHFYDLQQQWHKKTFVNISILSCRNHSANRTKADNVGLKCTKPAKNFNPQVTS